MPAALNFHGCLQGSRSGKQNITPQQHFETAQVALQNDDFKKAIRHFQQASDAEPEVTHPQTLSPLDCLSRLRQPSS